MVGSPATLQHAYEAIQRPVSIDYAVMEGAAQNGQVVMDKPAAALLADDDVREFYLGLGAEGTAKSFRDVKHYKRKKRWLS